MTTMMYEEEIKQLRVDVKTEGIFRTIQQQVEGRIKGAKPIDVKFAKALGDSMINWWTVDMMLRKFANQHHLPEENIRLRTCPKEILIFDKFDLIEKIKSALEQTKRSYRPNQYESLLVGLATGLNIAISEEDALYVPQPLTTDRGPLKSFNRTVAIEEGEKLRGSILTESKGIVSVVQSGSSTVKRFSDKQVNQLVKQAKELFPGYCVIIVSDKPILRKIVKKGTKMFPAQHLTFLQELHSEYSINDADMIKTPTDINELIALFYASDKILITDGFWAWLSAGSKVMRKDRQGKLQPNDIFVLHTVADAYHWGIPGANTISRPDILAFSDNDGFIYAKDYYQLNTGKQLSEFSTLPLEHGVFQEDIDSFTHSLTALPSV